MNEVNENIVNFLKIIADTTRLSILQFLKNNETTASEIQGALNKSQSTISQQLKLLINVELVSFRRVGAKKFYKIKNPEIFNILSIIMAFISNQNKEKIDQLTSIDILDTLH